MRVVIQRVSKASVRIQGETSGEIGKGLLILLGIEEADDLEDIQWLIGKITKMRIFPDAEGKMNLSLKDADGDLLICLLYTSPSPRDRG